MPLNETLAIAGAPVPVPTIDPGKSTSEFKALLLGFALQAVALAFAAINPRFGTHLVLTATGRTIITSVVTASVPLLMGWYATLRNSLKKAHLGAVGAIIQQQIIANATPTRGGFAVGGSALGTQLTNTSGITVTPTPGVTNAPIITPGQPGSV